MTKITKHTSRAKAIDFNEWVFGYYVYLPNTQPHGQIVGNEGSDLIIAPNGSKIKIDFTTLCKFSCVFDKNGYGIWEHDLVLEMDFYHEDEEHEHMVREVYFSDGAFTIDYPEHETELFLGACDRKNLLKVGNYFDNKDLAGLTKSELREKGF